ncbi:MAG: stage II sporulation protein M [Chloroflexi bacterium]|nr:stage II sporulation protein M [Chloroflexota bacterium]
MAEGLGAGRRKDTSRLLSGRSSLVVVAAFVAAMAVGYVAGPNTIQASPLLKELGGIAGLLRGLPPFVMFILIFLNNAVKSLLVILAGLGFGVLPIIFVIVNGLLIGFVVRLATPKVALAGILPHGVFELPAVLFASALGVHLGTVIWRKARGEVADIPGHIARAMKAYLLVILPALLIAAVIETYVTPLVMRAAA